MLDKSFGQLCTFFHKLSLPKTPFLLTVPGESFQQTPTCVEHLLLLSLLIQGRCVGNSGKAGLEGARAAPRIRGSECVKF